MKFIGAVVAFLAAAGIITAVSAQPVPQDKIKITEDACLVSVLWVDGFQDSTGYQISVNGPVIYSGDIDDVIGDQDNSKVLVAFEAEEGDVVVARLFVDGEDDFVDTETVGACPTPTPTTTPTSTATATATPVNTATPTFTPVVITEQVFVPVVVPATPQVITQERVVERVVERVITPPNTGGAGLAVAPADWEWGGGGWGGPSHCFWFDYIQRWICV